MLIMIVKYHHLKKIIHNATIAVITVHLHEVNIE